MNCKEQSGAGRDAGIDLMKTIAIFGVIVIHTCSGGFSNPILSFDWLSAILWGSVVRASVPIFFMCSGALLLTPHKQLSLKKLFTRNLPHIILAMLVWASAYKVYGLFTAGNLTLSACIHGLKEVLLMKQEFHLYFLQIIILVYLFLPITRVFVKNATQKELLYALAVWFLFGIVYPTVKSYWPFNLLTGIPVQWAMNMTYAAIGYGILGYYLTCYPIPRKYGVLLCGVGAALVFGLTVMKSAEIGKLYTNFFEGMSVGVALLAMGLFGAFYSFRSSMKGRALTVVTKLSKGSFCIYLVHVFVLYLFGFLHITVNGAPCLISVPVLSCANLVISFVCYWVLSKIPVVNRWLI